MTKYLISAAVGAVIAAGAFAAPASAQSVGFSINSGDGYHHRGHHRGYYNSGPGVRVYSGRSSYRDCYTKRTVKWVNGRKIVREREICD